MPQVPQQDPNAPPESVSVSDFSGLKNTVPRERLSSHELERAVNIDLNDVGQVGRRRGYTKVDSASWHSIKGPLAGKVYGVKNGTLGIIRPDFTFFSLGILIGAAPVCYTVVDNIVYFSSADMAGIVTPNETVQPWGATDGQGFWDSPVYSPTDTLGAVGGKLLGDPPKATQIEAYKGRIYLGDGKSLWFTELFRYHYVNRTRGFYPFEHDITLVMSVSDGIYVGTTGGLYFLEENRYDMREYSSLKLIQITSVAVLPGSGVIVPADRVHPQAMQQPMATTAAVVMMTDDGIMACFDSGQAYNLTHEKVVLPSGVSAAGLYRQDQGANHYVAVVDSAGAPTVNARIGDFIDAEIIRAADRQGG